MGIGISVPHRRIHHSGGVPGSFYSDNSAARYMTYNPTTGGNQKTFTFSVWTRRAALAESQVFIDCNGGNDYVLWHTDNTLHAVMWNAGNSRYDLAYSTNVSSGITAWDHVVFSMDTTQATASNRSKLWLNGALVTLGDNTLGIIQNELMHWGSTDPHHVGFINTGQGWHGWQTEHVMCEGQVYVPSDFASAGLPIDDLSGLTFGDRGYWMRFQDEDDMGKDSSGNGNDFTLTNVTSAEHSTETKTTWVKIRQETEMTLR
jgi:hypothetical protein